MMTVFPIIRVKAHLTETAERNAACIRILFAKTRGH